MNLDKITKVRIQLGTILILAVFALSLIFSQSATPDNQLLFGLKRIQEKVYLKLSGSEGRLVYMKILLDKRLVELDKMVRAESYCCILNAAQRYSTLAGQITETIESNNMKDKASSIIEQFQAHKKVLQETYRVYPKNMDNFEYKYIEDDINYLDLYLDKLTKLQ